MQCFTFIFPKRKSGLKYGYININIYKHIPEKISENLKLLFFE